MIAIFLNESQNLVKLLYIVHILSIVAAFGPLFLYPRMQRAGETSVIAALHMKLVFPALVLLWVVGMGMAGVNKFDLAAMPWITITIALWVAAVAVSWFLIKPAIGDASEAATKKMSAGIGITHLIFTISLVLMIFKPFVDGSYVINPDPDVSLLPRFRCVVVSGRPRPSGRGRSASKGYDERSDPRR